MTAGWRAAAFAICAAWASWSGGFLSEPAAADDTAPGDPIGTADMLSDGTLTLRLRAEGPGVVGDGYFNVPTDDPRYQEIERHVGPIGPGETKPFRPWPPQPDGSDKQPPEPSR